MTRTPRFVVRTMATTFATVVFIVAAVLLVVTLIVRDRMRTTVIDHLTTQQGMLRTLEQELWRYAGSQFDADVVRALAVLAPTLRLDHDRIEAPFPQGSRATLVNFPRS